MYDCFSCNCTYCCADMYLDMLKHIKELLEEKGKEEAMKYIEEEIKYYKSYT